MDSLIRLMFMFYHIFSKSYSVECPRPRRHCGPRGHRDHIAVSTSAKLRACKIPIILCGRDYSKANHNGGGVATSGPFCGVHPGIARTGQSGKSSISGWSPWQCSGSSWGAVVRVASTRCCSPVVCVCVWCHYLLIFCTQETSL